MQPDPTNTTTEAPPAGGGAHPPQGGLAGLLASPLPMVLAMVGIFYFLMLRPQQRRQRETDALLKALRKGDKVRTSGGIRGEILDLTESEVTLLIADKVKINVLRSHVVQRIGAEPASANATDKEKA